MTENSLHLALIPYFFLLIHDHSKDPPPHPRNERKSYRHTLIIIAHKLDLKSLHKSTFFMQGNKLTRRRFSSSTVGLTGLCFS